jgi:hypothetical protein
MANIAPAKLYYGMMTMVYDNILLSFANKNYYMSI